MHVLTVRFAPCRLRYFGDGITAAHAGMCSVQRTLGRSSGRESFRRRAFPLELMHQAAFASVTYAGGMCVPGAEKEVVTSARAALKLAPPSTQKNIQRAIAALNPDESAKSDADSPPQVRLASQKVVDGISSSEDEPAADQGAECEHDIQTVAVRIPAYFIFPVLIVVSFPAVAWLLWDYLAMELEMTEEILECYRNLAILVHNPAYISLMSFVWVLVIAGPYIVSAKAAASSPKVPAEQPVDDLEPPAEVEDVVKSASPPPESSETKIPAEIATRLDAEAERLEDLCTSLREWSFNFEKKGVKCYTRKRSKLASGRGTGIIPFPPKAVLDFIIAHADGKNPKTFELDPDLKDTERVVEWNANTWMDYLTSKAILTVSSRDFLNISHWRTINDDQILFFGIPHVDDDLRPRIRTAVRGEAAGAWLLKPVDGGKATELTKVVEINLNGWIPSYVVRKVTASQGMQIAKVSEMMVRDMKPD